MVLKSVVPSIPDWHLLWPQPFLAALFSAAHVRWCLPFRGKCLTVHRDCLPMPSHFLLESCWPGLWATGVNLPFTPFSFGLCRRSSLCSNPRMKSHTGNLILSGPSGCRSCAAPAALAVTALSSTRATSRRRGPAWWTKNWNSTSYPAQRSVTCLPDAFLPGQSFPGPKPRLVGLLDPVKGYFYPESRVLGLFFFGGEWYVHAYGLIIWWKLSWEGYTYIFCIQFQEVPFWYTYMGSLGLWIPGNPKLVRNLPTFVAHSEISEPFQDLDSLQWTSWLSAKH